MAGWVEVYVSPQSEKAEEKRRYLEEQGISCMMQAGREGQPSSGESIMPRGRYARVNTVYAVLVKEAYKEEAERLLRSR